MSFKDSAIGQFLTGKGFDDILKVAELIPGVGTVASSLEMVKNAVVGSPAFGQLAPEVQQQFGALYDQESQRLKNEEDAQAQAEKARLDDVANARAREIAIANTTKKDWMMPATGVIGLIAFGFVVWAAIYVNIPSANKDLFSMLMGNVMGIALTIFSFYYGSSKGSADKTQIIKNQQQ